MGVVNEADVRAAKGLHKKPERPDKRVEIETLLREAFGDKAVDRLLKILDGDKDDGQQDG